MATPRSNSYSAPSGGGVFAGRTALPVPNVWQALTVAPHSRRVITSSLQGSGTKQTYDPTVALAAEALTPITVQAIAYRAFSTFVPADDGYVYYVGGLHSNYQGNEIDRMVLPTSAGSTVITTEISHQPNMPPEGKFSGYASGSGGYIYRQYGAGLADNSNWQPYPGHQWTKNQWNPEWGFFSQIAHALQDAYPSGAYQVIGGVLQSSAAQPADDYGDQSEDSGIVSFDWATRKYKTWISSTTQPFPRNYLGRSGVSDWNASLGEQLFFATNGGVTYISKFTAAGGFVALPSTSLIGGFPFESGNGLLIRHLEADRYLVLRQDDDLPGGAFVQRIWTFDSAGAGDARFAELTWPSVTSDAVLKDPFTYCVDKQGRRVFWIVFANVGVPIRFYVSSFDSLMNWTLLTFSPAITIPAVQYADAWLAGCRQPLIYKSGWLFLMDDGDGGSGANDPGYLNGAINPRRCYVGEA